MSRIGITGHTNLTPATVPLVAAALRAALADRVPAATVGVTCLARGADQLFARVLLGLGGTVEVVLPAADYRTRKVAPDDAAEFDALLAGAATVRTMPFPESNRAAYLAASAAVLDDVEEMLAVWDGDPSGGRGGTADVVAAARDRGIPVTVIWPDGAARDPSS